MANTRSGASRQNTPASGSEATSATAPAGGNEATSAPAPTGGRSTNPTQPPDDDALLQSRTAADMEAINKRIEELETLKAAQDRLANLLKETTGFTLEEIRGKRQGRRKSNSSTSSSEGPDLKTEHITTFKKSWSFQQREEWLGDLELAFRRAPKKFKSPAKKILYALDQMEGEARSIWKRYVQAQESPEIADALYEDYPGFVSWTLTLLKNAENREIEIAKKIEKAAQGSQQSPRDFDLYLDALEKQVEPKTDTARAMTFYAKLDGGFQTYLEGYGGDKPTNRAAMVSWAQVKWEAYTANVKRRREDSDPGPYKKQRGARRDTPTPGPADAETRNPIGREGTPLKCYNCGSEEHLANSDKCPQNQEAGVNEASQGRFGSDSFRGRGGYRGRGNYRGNGRAP